MQKPKERKDSEQAADGGRRLLSRVSSVAMFAGLAGGYGAFAYIAGRFLYPARPPLKSWLFVTELAAVPVGETILYRTPAGETVNITRRGNTGAREDFTALSSTCPHLGCQVHWEDDKQRYFCPCHNGTFDAAGKGTGGPPGDAGLELPRFALKTEGGMLFIEAPSESLASAGQDGGEGRIVEQLDGIRGPGHDPCLTSAGAPRRFDPDQA